MNPSLDATFWNERYGSPDYFYGTAPNDFLASVAPEIPAGPVLCLAEGEGRNAIFLASRGHAATAVDQSEAGLAKARALAQTRGVPLTGVAADLAEFTIAPQTWSGIVAIFMHLPPALRCSVLARAAAGLRPGGVFVMEAYRPAQLGYGTGGPKDVTLLPTLNELRAELGDLDFLIAREIERDVREGGGHTGPSAVVQVLARRPM
ncbi:MAG TPA: methyltransferase domain-containing protein [Opitutaceae bacterium]|nr:methyltransferase domain-containing protein [Opitutaceae bacterium]